MRPPAAANSRNGYMAGIAWRAASATSCSMRLLKKGSLPTSSAPVRTWTRLTKALSISRSVLAFNICTFSPTTGAAASTSLVVMSNIGLFGFSRKPIVSVLGTRSRNSASPFAPSSPANELTPVRLPPGRLRLEPISKSPEEDKEASELYEAEEVVGVVFPTDEDAALPLNPSKEALHE